MNFETLLRTLYALENETEVTNDSLSETLAQETFNRMKNALGFVFEINWNKDINFIELMSLSEEEEKSYFSVQEKRYREFYRIIREDLNKCTFLYYYAILMCVIKEYTDFKNITNALTKIFSSMLSGFPKYDIKSFDKVFNHKTSKNKRELLEDYYNEIVDSCAGQKEKLKISRVLTKCIINTDDIYDICLKYDKGGMALLENNEALKALSILYFKLEEMYCELLGNETKNFSRLLKRYKKCFNDISDEEFNMIKYLYKLSNEHNYIICDGKAGFRKWGLLKSDERTHLANLIEKAFTDNDENYKTSKKLKKKTNDEIQRKYIIINNLYFKYFNNSTHCLELYSLRERMLKFLLSDLHDNICRKMILDGSIFEYVEENKDILDDELYKKFVRKTEGLYKISQEVTEYLSNKKGSSIEKLIK